MQRIWIAVVVSFLIELRYLLICNVLNLSAVLFEFRFAMLATVSFLFSAPFPFGVAIKWLLYQRSITKERNEFKKFMQITSGENLEISIYLDPFRIRYANMRYNIDCVNIPVQVPEESIVCPNLRSRVVKKNTITKTGTRGLYFFRTRYGIINLKLDCLGSRSSHECE